MDELHQKNKKITIGIAVTAITEMAPLLRFPAFPSTATWIMRRGKRVAYPFLLHKAIIFYTDKWSKKSCYPTQVPIPVIFSFQSISPMAHCYINPSVLCPVRH